MLTGYSLLLKPRAGSKMSVRAASNAKWVLVADSVVFGYVIESTADTNDDEKSFSCRSTVASSLKEMMPTRTLFWSTNSSSRVTTPFTKFFIFLKFPGTPPASASSMVDEASNMNTTSPIG